MAKPPDDDPYHHLHDEAYAEPYAAGRVGWRALVTTAGRRTENLDGPWRFVLDLHDEGLRQRWFAQDDAPLGSWTAPRDYDGGGWQSIAVPSCWNMARPEWFYFEGGAWYSRTFDYRAAKPGERVILRAGAANYEARVFINGVFAGAHRGGSTPFCVELTAHLKSGPNRLQIQVENRRQPHRVPMNHTDWFNYGGLYREVSLLRLPAVFIRDFGAALVPGSGGRKIALDIEVSDPVDGEALIDIAGLAGPIRLPVRGGRGAAEIEARPRLWAPGHSTLHDVSVRFAEDEIRDRVGFREICREGRHLTLNGEALFLRGVGLHEDDAATGKCVSENDLRRAFAHARELNANFLRLSHYPHHERAAQIADEEGVLLWEEIPVYWAIAFDCPDTFADADNQLRELIRRDRNRASVIIWGVGNENADTDSRLGFMSRLAEAARQADPARLVGAACLINREEFRIADRLAAHLDIVGINEYFGWYEPSFDGLKRLLANSSPDRPVIITETGADAVAGRRGRNDELFTEDQQADVLRQQIAITHETPYIGGFCPWLLYDFRSERRQNGAQRGFNRKGLIDADKRTKKLAFEVVAEQYAERAAAQTSPEPPPRKASA
jgi:beta-glucuronidase